MKILLVGGDDYGAVNFQEVHGSVLVKDILDDIDKYEPQDGEEFWDLRVTEVEGEIPSPEFIKFAKGAIDYDDSKHNMWYCETETI